MKTNSSPAVSILRNVRPRTQNGTTNLWRGRGGDRHNIKFPALSVGAAWRSQDLSFSLKTRRRLSDWVSNCLPHVQQKSVWRQRGSFIVQSFVSSPITPDITLRLNASELRCLWHNQRHGSTLPFDINPGVSVVAARRYGCLSVDTVDSKKPNVSLRSCLCSFAY